MSSQKISRIEFVIILAALFATIAFAVDAMLPAIPQITSTMTPDAPNRAPLVVTVFVLGMGLGTVFSGAISDAIGRKGAIVGGALIYIAGAVAAANAPTIELLLAARFVQGIGVAGPRIAGMALVRDLFAGRQMAQIVSIIMMVFVLVPAAAPYVGALVIDLWNWRAVFTANAVFAGVAALWLFLRIGETLPPDRRIPFRPAPLIESARLVLSDRHVLLYTGVLTLAFAILYAMITSIQQIYDVYFDKAAEFPMWFLITALVSGVSTALNAAFVVRVGMRRMATSAYIAQTFLSLGVLALFLSGALPQGALFPVYFLWNVGIFFMIGMTLGNLNALALQPMGARAGMASSMISAISTICGALLAVPVSTLFDGTPRPLMAGAFVFSAGAWALMTRARDIPEPDAAE